MNANITETSSAGLSLQPQVKICPKCQHKRTADDHGPDWQCPGCGVAYNKATVPSPAVAHKVNSAPRARGSQEINRDELETATPGAISLSMQGRIGRLRYLAFSWPIVVLGSLLGMVAAVIVPLHKTSGTMLMILAGVLCLWMPLRLMALRLHDLNRSAKWLLALLLLPGVAFAVGGPQLATICAGSFWIIALLLIALPGSESDNDYGPPPGANTTLVNVGAGIIVVLMALGVVGNIRLMRSGKLNSAVFRGQGAAEEQPGSGNVQNGADAETQKAARLTRWDFVGTWRGRNMSLRVDKYGDGDFLHLDGNYSIKADGPLRVLDGNRISIGIGPDPKVLIVTVPPHVEGGAAKMTLNGVELVRNN
jgi:uncharacterized membrane protein YhaH (DUF805 family)